MTATPLHSVPRRGGPLDLLNARVPVEYRKGAIIYSALKQPAHLHVVVRGRVMVTRGVGDRRVVMDVYGPEEFFGECVLADVRQLPEEAIALERTDVMRWTKKELEELVLDRPQLGVALLQVLARRTMDVGDRLEDCLGERTAGRVLRSLIRLSERLAVMGDSDSVSLPPLTHQILSEYVGSKREVVTQHMIEFRRQGLLDYSRRGIRLTARAFQAAHGGDEAPAPSTIA